MPEPHEDNPLDNVEMFFFGILNKDVFFGIDLRAGKLPNQQVFFINHDNDWIETQRIFYAQNSGINPDYAYAQVFNHFGKLCLESLPIIESAHPEIPPLETAPLVCFKLTTQQLLASIEWRDTHKTVIERASAEALADLQRIITIAEEEDANYEALTETELLTQINRGSPDWYTLYQNPKEA